MKSSFKKILITGFEPFDGDSTNPSAELLKWLNLNKEELDFSINTLLLPVSFTNSYTLLDNEIQKLSPSHVILTGFAKNRSDLTVERIGINWVDARIPDNDGLVLKSQKINEATEDGIFSTLPADHLVQAALAISCPAKVSSSAGEYVCNYLLYSFLINYKNCPGTFIHIPSSTDYETYFRGILAILKYI